MSVETVNVAEVKLDTQNNWEHCLVPLLTALDWNGTERALRESLPHFAQISSGVMFCQVMTHLNYENSMIKVRLGDIDSRLLPCLFVADSGAVHVVRSIDEEKVEIFSGDHNKELIIPVTEQKDFFAQGHAYLFNEIKAEDMPGHIGRNWLRSTYEKNKTLIYSALALSLALNLLAMATPLFVMSVYNRVIGAASISMLVEFFIGIAIALAGTVIIQKMRAKFLAVIGARFDQRIGNGIFEKLLYIAPIYTETASVGSQVARIKDFDRLREFISGPMLTVLFDTPFIVVTLAIIAILGGSLVIIPIVLMAVYFILGFIFKKISKRLAMDSSNAGAKRQEYLLETINKMRALKYTSAEDEWYERFRELSAKTTFCNFRISVVSAIESSLSDAIMIIAGLLVVSFGAVKVIDGTIGVGAIVAIMMLIWRVLAPLKTFFSVMPRIQQVINSMQQINRLMKIPPETATADLANVHRRHFVGGITFNRVSFRYQATLEPALMGVSFKIAPSEVVGVIGRNGSGKSTILKLLMTLYQPQAGGVQIDNRDIRQLNPIELRQSIGYLPQTPQLFYGTIAANLRMSEPSATDEELRDAARTAGILDDIERLPEGFNTQIRDFSDSNLASSFQQGLCLTRAFLKKSSILLLDEPGNVLDWEADQHLMRVIDQLRGHVTVVMVTHRPSHLKKVDKVLFLEQGQLALQGTPEEVLPQIPAGVI